MACETNYRPAVLLEGAVSGSFIRYHDGLRYGRQRVRGVRVGRCRCGRPATKLIDSGSGVAGWRRLEPTCADCGGWSAALKFDAFAECLGESVSVCSDLEPTPSDEEAGGGPIAVAPGTSEPRLETTDAKTSLAVVAGEAALLQARLDELQRQLARLSDGEPPAGQ
jgi:hypothetical protein